MNKGTGGIVLILFCVHFRIEKMSKYCLQCYLGSRVFITGEGQYKNGTAEDKKHCGIGFELDVSVKTPDF